MRGCLLPLFPGRGPFFPVSIKGSDSSQHWHSVGAPEGAAGAPPCFPKMPPKGAENALGWGGGGAQLLYLGSGSSGGGLVYTGLCLMFPFCVF